MKSILKKILVRILGNQVKRLRKHHKFKIIGVVGSIGKTSTKIAIAKTLALEKRVRFQEGNYNDILSVPLVFFGQKMPILWNIFSWFWIILKNEFQILFRYSFDLVVVELGTDAPGQIIEFKKYLWLDIAVVTAITPEHMEFFQDLKEVAEEEWSVRFFANKVFANRDLCQILPIGADRSENFDHNRIIFYGLPIDSIYEFLSFSKAKDYCASAAIVVAKEFKVSDENIKKSLNKFEGFAGRMQKLNGIKNSIIIDDTYNASPEAVKMALQTLYSFEAPQKIAILGMMNELGKFSEIEHRKIGQFCDPNFLDLIITIGKDANQFLAPEARKNGCNVYEAKNSIDAGKYLKDKIKNKAVILAKGSQNGVFAEEAIKSLLADTKDIFKLVRQEKSWLKKKELNGEI